jgi:hypothetical protein
MGHVAAAMEEAISLIISVFPRSTDVPDVHCSWQTWAVSINKFRLAFAFWLRGDQSIINALFSSCILERLGRNEVSLHPSGQEEEGEEEEEEEEEGGGGLAGAFLSWRRI